MVSISVYMTHDMCIYAFYESNHAITGFGPYRLQQLLEMIGVGEKRTRLPGFRQVQAHQIRAYYTS